MKISPECECTGCDYCRDRKHLDTSVFSQCRRPALASANSAKCEECFKAINGQDSPTRQKIKTPGTWFFVSQSFPGLKWRVVPISESQGRAMRDRGEKLAFDTPAQAHAVAKRLNEERKRR